MAYVYFKCSCGKSLAVDERGVGRAIACVDCGKQVVVPEWDYEFDCSKCAATFGAASNIAGDEVQCVDCGNKFVVPANTPLPQNELDRVLTGERTDVLIDEVQPAAASGEPNHMPSQSVPSRKMFPPAINWTRFFTVLYRLTVVLAVLFVVVMGSDWLILNINRSNADLDLAIRQSRDQVDLSSANIILEKAIDQYPLAFAHARQAKQLLAENQARLSDTTNLAVVIALTKTDKDSGRAANLLAKAVCKYRRATNCAEAETLVKAIQSRANDTWMLAAAMNNAQMTEDVSERIALLEKTLAECPCATNRADAEAMIAFARRQWKETEGLEQAIRQAQQEGDPAACAKLLVDALAKYPKAANREDALVFLKKIQTRVKGQIKDPLLKAIADAKKQDTFVAAIQVLKEALKENSDSPYRVEAEQVLAVYQKRLLEAAKDQKAALTDDAEAVPDESDNSGYVFLPPNKALVGAGGALSLYDSPFVNKIAAMNYGIEVRLQKLAGSNEKGGSGGAPSADSLRYVPRLILSAKGGNIPRGSIVIVEYYLEDPRDKAAAQRAEVENIPFPTMSRGQTVAVDCRGIECKQHGKIAASKKNEKIAADKFHGIIVSVYGGGRELLLQKCSTIKLIKQCSLQSY
jgi:DNA-directed RNA polymerase subunit RPC12/RpoP